jgi:DNA-binding transcriptional ArsR family regulator
MKYNSGKMIRVNVCDILVVADRRRRAPFGPASRGTPYSMGMAIDPPPSPPSGPGGDGGPRASWTFLTNHSHVLICLARDPHSRIRDLAEAVGITERAVQGILNDLKEAGCITLTRVGRRNHYEVIDDRPMRHAVERGHRVGELLSVMAPEAPPERG